MVHRRRFPFWRIVAGLVFGLTVGIGTVVVGAEKLSPQGAICLRMDDTHYKRTDNNVYALMFDTTTGALARFRPTQMMTWETMSPNGRYSFFQYWEVNNPRSVSSPIKVLFRSIENDKFVVHSAYDLHDLVHFGFIMWSPDGNRVAYPAGLRDQTQKVNSLWQRAIIIANADGSDYKIVPTDPVTPEKLSWSADSAYLAVSIAPDTLSIIAADGSITHKIVSQQGRRDFSWSPEGHQIAYISDSVLRFVTPSRTGLIENQSFPLPKRAIAETHSMKWSPNGRYLLLITPVSPSDGFYHLTIFGKDGSLAAEIGTTYIQGWDLPFWSVDGQLLVHTPANTNTLAAYHIDNGSSEALLTDIAVPVIVAPDQLKLFAVKKEVSGLSIIALNIPDRRLTTVLGNIDEVTSMDLGGMQSDVLLTVTRRSDRYTLDTIHLNTLQVTHLQDKLMKMPQIIRYPYTQYIWEANHGAMGAGSYFPGNGRLTELTLDSSQIIDIDQTSIAWSPNHRAGLVVSEDKADPQKNTIQIVYSNGNRPWVIQEQGGSLGNLLWSPGDSAVAYLQWQRSTGRYTHEILQTDSAHQWSFDLSVDYTSFTWTSCAPRYSSAPNYSSRNFGTQ
jgi:hypothetical protein